MVQKLQWNFSMIAYFNLFQLIDHFQIEAIYSLVWSESLVGQNSILHCRTYSLVNSAMNWMQISCIPTGKTLGEKSIRFFFNERYPEPNQISEYFCKILENIQQNVAQYSEIFASRDGMISLLSIFLLLLLVRVFQFFTSCRQFGLKKNYAQNISIETNFNKIKIQLEFLF